jgi:hypothetical protein
MVVTPAMSFVLSTMKYKQNTSERRSCRHLLLILSNFPMFVVLLSVRNKLSWDPELQRGHGRISEPATFITHHSEHDMENYTRKALPK